MEIVLIRHGKTKGNVLKKYLGRTDEGLCDEGKEQLLRVIHQGIYPQVEHVYASPMARCMETAQHIFGQQSIEAYSLLRECDFGRFEYKDYDELKDEPDYQVWLESNGTIPFPEGEHPIEFRSRCQQGFADKVDEAIEQGKQSVAFVVHGGTIMSILEKFAHPQEEFYHWHVGNCLGYKLRLDVDQWKEHLRVTVVEKLEERSVE